MWHLVFDKWILTGESLGEKNLAFGWKADHRAACVTVADGFQLIRITPMARQHGLGCIQRMRPLASALQSLVSGKRLGKVAIILLHILILDLGGE